MGSQQVLGSGLLDGWIPTTYRIPLVCFCNMHGSGFVSGSPPPPTCHHHYHHPPPPPPHRLPPAPHHHCLDICMVQFRGFMVSWVPPPGFPATCHLLRHHPGSLGFLHPWFHHHTTAWTALLSSRLVRCRLCHHLPRLLPPAFCPPLPHHHYHTATCTTTTTTPPPPCLLLPCLPISHATTCTTTAYLRFGSCLPPPPALPGLVGDNTGHGQPDPTAQIRAFCRASCLQHAGCCWFLFLVLVVPGWLRFHLHVSWRFFHTPPTTTTPTTAYLLSPPLYLPAMRLGWILPTC